MLTLPFYVFPYLAILCVLLIASVWRRNGAMFRTAFTIGLNWLACTGTAYLLNSESPWGWFALYDAMAAIIITFRPAGKMQAAIGGIYVAMVLCHGVYGTTALLGDTPDTTFYLNTLDVLSSAALLLMVLWIGGHLGLVGVGWMADRLHLRKADSAAVASRLASMD